MPRAENDATMYYVRGLAPHACESCLTECDGAWRFSGADAVVLEDHPCCARCWEEFTAALQEELGAESITAAEVEARLARGRS